MKYVKAFLILYVISFALIAFNDYKKKPPVEVIQGGLKVGNCFALTLGRQPA